MSGAARALVGNARWGAACASVGPCASQTASRLNRFAYIAAGVTLEDGVFIGPHAVFTDDRVPRAVNPNLSLKTRANWVEGQTLVREGAAVGASASVVCGVTIGRWAIVGAGAVVARDVPDFAKVAGSPAFASSDMSAAAATRWRIPRLPHPVRTAAHSRPDLPQQVSRTGSASCFSDGSRGAALREPLNAFLQRSKERQIESVQRSGIPTPAWHPASSPSVRYPRRHY